jgi:enoyl-CoA hydratase
MAEIRIERSHQIATVTLSNPGKLNALSVAMWDALATAFHTLSDDVSLRCVILRGEDGHFASGADIEEFAQVRNNAQQGISYHTVTIANALDAVLNCIHPTIAAIEGNCIGGGFEIACACDLRIADAEARFGVPINRLGFALAPAEMQLLLDTLGKSTVLELLLEGRIFNADEAKQKGLVNRISSNLAQEIKATAERITSGAPLAARVNKQLARQLSAKPHSLTKEECNAAFALLDSYDYQEGVQSFLGKRKPNFIGK